VSNVAHSNKEKKGLMKMKLTAKEAADRLGVSYVIAAGILSHLEEKGRAKVVEKRFHASGKGKPTRVYEVEATTVLDFGSTPVTVETPVVEAVTAVETPVATETETVVETVTETVEKIETLDHVAAAIERLKQAQDSEAA
jgi:predicted ArsR family transcriptional regulator